MDKLKARKIWWAACLLYVTAIYATLGVAPKLWEIIDGIADGKGILVLYALGVASVSAVFLYLVFVKKETGPASYFLFAVFVCIFFILNKLAKFPAEKIHLLEYTGLSVVVYNALKIDINRYEIKLYITGIAVCLAVGFVDELIQFFLPARVFDWRDIALNFTSSITAFMIIRFNILRFTPLEFKKF